MDVWGALRILRSRWYVLLPALAIAVALAGITYKAADPRFGSLAVLVLTAPNSGPAFSPGTPPDQVSRVNPLLAFDGSLSTTAQIISQVLRDPATQESLGVTADSEDSYTVGTGELGGPFIFIYVESGTQGRAVSLTVDLVGRVDEELATRQRELGAPEPTFITTQTLVRPTEPEPIQSGRIRSAGAVFVLGMFLALAATFAAESLLPAAVRCRRMATATPEAPAPAALEPVTLAVAPVSVVATMPGLRPTPRPRSGAAVPGQSPPRPHPPARPRPGPRSPLTTTDRFSPVGASGPMNGDHKSVAGGSDA